MPVLVSCATETSHQVLRSGLLMGARMVGLGKVVFRLEGGIGVLLQFWLRWG